MKPIVLAAIIEAIWLLAWGATLLLSQPRRPTGTAGKAGELPVAVEAMLSRRLREWVPAAVDATFADLVRKGRLEIGAGEVPLGGVKGELSPWERLVYDDVAVGVRRNPAGYAPIAALNDGPIAKVAWKPFKDAVLAEAKQRRLIKQRVPGVLVAGLGLAGLTGPLSLSRGHFKGILMALLVGGEPGERTADLAQ